MLSYFVLWSGKGQLRQRNGRMMTNEEVYGANGEIISRETEELGDLPLCRFVYHKSLKT
jgi:hypothetical protein